MVTFKYVKIKNFRSIKDATLHFKSGIWRIVGSNNDAEGFDSNASGKSTALSALQQCLFNRTIFGTAIDDTYHKQQNSGYILETEFVIDDNTYKIINDRTSMKITLYRLSDGDYVDMGIRSIPHAISIIQDLIGMDFNTFIATTYISHSTVIEMLEHFTSSALLKVVLNFDRLYTIDKVIKDQLKVSAEQTRLLAARVASIKESLLVLDSFTRTNVSPIRKKLEALILHKTDLISGPLKLEIDTLNSKIQTDKSYVTKLVAELSAHKIKLSSTICSCCGQTITVDSVSINKHIDILEADIAAYNKIIQENTGTVDVCNAEMQTQLAAVSLDIEHYQKLISVAEYKNDLYNQYKKQADELRKQLVDYEKTIKIEYAKQDVYQAIIDTIKSGAPLKQLIHNFCTVFNLYIDEFTPLVSIDYLIIKARAKKNNLEFVVYDSRFNKEINTNELSGGELTRTRIILLLALLKAIQTLTGVSSNILVFDEALDALDASAAGDLASLFNHLSISHDKFIALVSHGSQLNSIEFDGYIMATKTNGVSTITQG